MDSNEYPTSGQLSQEQLDSLAGIDVYTMPIKVAEDGMKTLDGKFVSKINEEYNVELFPNLDNNSIGMERIWNVSDAELKLADDLDKNLPSSGDELINRAYEMGCPDIFPKISENEHKVLRDDGKIPMHEKWKDYIANNKIAIDTLLNLSGLYSFTDDQDALDARIKGLIV